MFLLRNIKDVSIFLMKKAPYLLLWFKIYDGLKVDPKSVVSKQICTGGRESSGVYLFVSHDSRKKKKKKKKINTFLSL